MRTKNPETFKAIEEFVNEYTERHGVSPTVREIHAGNDVAYLAERERRREQYIKPLKEITK